MKSIKHTLTERWYAWENARQAAMEDQEVNLYANANRGESAYQPKEPELDSLPAGDAQTSSEVSSTYTPPPPMATGRGEARV
jgi:large subunit ribosomal protein L47